MKNAIVALLLFTGAAFPYVVGYHVEPVKALWSGRADPRPDHGVAQTVTCNFDSLSYVELFAGDSGSTGSGYRVGVWEGNTELTFATGVQHQPTSWVLFDNWNPPGVAFTKGKEYEFRFTRTGSDSIQYYYDNNAYDYGHIVIGGGELQPPPGTAPDLCMRVYGRMNPLDSTWLSVQVHSSGTGGALSLARDEIGIAWVGDDLGHWNAWHDNPSLVLDRCRACMDSGFQVRGYLAYGLGFLDESTQVSSRGTEPGDTFSLESYPPRGLFATLSADTNYWAGYCESIMESLPGVKYWAVWGEPNACWNWHDPDTAYYKGTTSGYKGDSWIDTPGVSGTQYLIDQSLTRV